MNNDCVVIKYVISGACANVVVTFEHGDVRRVSFCAYIQSFHRMPFEPGSALKFVRVYASEPAT